MLFCPGGYWTERESTIKNEKSTIKNDDKPIAKPFVVLREEFDDWAVLFDPDTGHGFGLSPTGVYMWKLLNGEHTMDALLEKLRDHADNVPGDVSEHIKGFVDTLAREGLAGFDRADFDLGSGPEKSSSSPSGASGEMAPFTYEPPQLVCLNSDQAAGVVTCNNTGSHATSTCNAHGNAACSSCSSGTGGGLCCSGTGSCASYSSACCGGACNDSCGCGGNIPVSYCATGGNCNFQCYYCYIGSGQ